MHMKRTEYPRPSYVREGWQALNGTWAFDYDDADAGMTERWFLGARALTREIEVPFVYQCRLSGIGERVQHDVVWYRRTVDLTMESDGMDVLLHFGAVDFRADVFINGIHAGAHEGGDSPFTVDMTPYLCSGPQRIDVRVWDPLTDETIPRGKQSWTREPKGIWYTPSTGIWQSVWIEYAPKQRIEDARFTTRFEDGREEIRLFLSAACRGETLRASYTVTFRGELIAEGALSCLSEETAVDIDIAQNHIFRQGFHDDGYAWTPEHPNLFDVTLRLLTPEGAAVDEVRTYFGFRKIHAQNGMVYLNNKPYYMKLVLDQGYWPEGLMTAPEDDAYRYDIETAKAMGFNGCRKHQKAEDPRFLYWADRLGYLVWGECASVPTFGSRQIGRVLQEWNAIVRRDYNHPSLIAWVPLNESWGTPWIQRDARMQHYAQTLYHMLRAIDGTRLVISNDGWSMTETDICAIHNYMHGERREEEKYRYFCETLSSAENLTGHPSTAWEIYADGFSHHGAPIVLSEFGGIAYAPAQTEAKCGKDWGYTYAQTQEEFLEEYARVMRAVFSSEALAGYCYTQLTDVEQEINGLMTYDRRPKADIAMIRECNRMYRRGRGCDEKKD